MSSEDQDLAQTLAPPVLTNLSPPDAASLPGTAWRGLSSQHEGSQQSFSQQASMFLADSQLDNMGQGVGLQLPAPPDLVMPPQTSTFPIQTAQTAPLMGRIASGTLPVFSQHNNYVLDGGSTFLTAPTRHPSVCKAEHKNSKAARRGPMDEMRQLVRILVKLMPESSHFLTVPDEGGGGNRVKEEHIKDYLNKVLGRSNDSSDEAPPYPEWGLVNGWAAYLSLLFTWATGSVISSDQALRCARRLPGRSWETLNEELEKLRLCPSAWPLPLRKEAVREIQKKYEETGQIPAPLPRAVQLAAVPLALMSVDAGAPLTSIVPGVIPLLAAETTLPTGKEANPTAKRPVANVLGEVAPQQPVQQQPCAIPNSLPVYAQSSFVQPMFTAATSAGAAAPLSYYQGPPGPAVKRRRKAGSNVIDLANLADYSELELWHIALTVLQEADFRRNTTPSDKFGNLQINHDMVKRIVDNFAPSAGVMVGPAHMAGLGAGYYVQPGHQNQASGGLLSVAPAQPGAPAAASAPAGMDAAAQLKRLALNGVNMSLLSQGAGTKGGQMVQVMHHGSPAIVGPAWPKAPAQQQQSVTGATPGGLQGQPPPSAAAQVSGQMSGGMMQAPQASHATVQQAPAGSQHTQSHAMIVATSAQQPQPQHSQQSHMQVVSHAGGPGVAATGNAGAAGSGAPSIVKPTVITDLLNLKAHASKEASKDSAGKQAGDIRLGSSSGAFKSYDKGGGGLEALVAAVAKLGDKCGGEQDEADADCRATSPHAAAQGPPLSQHHRTGGDNTLTRTGSGMPSPRNAAEPRKAESKAVGRSSAALPATEEVDETKGPTISMPANALAESAEVDGPTGPQPASSSAPLRNATSELRTRVHLQLDQAAQDVERRTQQPQQPLAPSASAPASTEGVGQPGGNAVTLAVTSAATSSAPANACATMPQQQPINLFVVPSSSSTMQVSGWAVPDGLAAIAHRGVSHQVLPMSFSALQQPLLFVGGVQGQVPGPYMLTATQMAALGTGVHVGMPSPPVAQQH